MLQPIHKDLCSKYQKTVRSLSHSVNPAILTGTQTKVQKLSSLQPYSFMVCTTTTKSSANRGNLSLTSEQDT